MELTEDRAKTQDTPTKTGPAGKVGSPAEVFAVFLRLGLTSFGGPIAHLGYYRDQLVVRRRWIDEDGYADLVALCQFLPGPASSQVGFSLGILRGNGLLGGLAAWVAFTLPSALIMLAFAMGAAVFTGPVAQGFLHGRGCSLRLRCRRFQPNRCDRAWRACRSLALPRQWDHPFGAVAVSGLTSQWLSRARDLRVPALGAAARRWRHWQSGSRVL